jgi:hypothetical protein
MANYDSTFARTIGFDRDSGASSAAAPSFTVAQTLVRFLLTMAVLFGLSVSFAWQMQAMLR